MRVMPDPRGEFDRSGPLVGGAALISTSVMVERAGAFPGTIEIDESTARRIHAIRSCKDAGPASSYTPVNWPGQVRLS